MEDAYFRLRGRQAGILGEFELNRMAVMVPLVKLEGQVNILFEERALTLNRQPGEVCFPGGAVEESDRNPVRAALRETCEELGITRNDMEFIAPLDVLITPYNSIVYPYLCEIDNPKAIHPNHSEVKSVFFVPLNYLKSTTPRVYDVRVFLDPGDDFPFDLIPGGKSYKWSTGTYRTYFYSYEGKVIWGMTARILVSFLELLKKSETEGLR
ncbi:MAG: CoA pyrophosphatase [Syntrophothermus sp.]|uniref:NUDIX hydrolase n=1 Tax=Syntrophothermus sp. TaxID=2736299 RepID=UPI0025811468|nr:CoA pyrophosphatase [Syntrophothermus sp.]NSW83714.1 CoA pyrophosphatase [Syntrophothermus sp.]